MEKEQYDPYYRDFPSNLLPVRTPFTRPGRFDAGHLFFYMTSMWKRWSLLQDETHADRMYDEARQCIPRTISQVWLLEKRYSTHHTHRLSSARQVRHHATRARSDISTVNRPHQLEKLLVVLREPARYYTRQGDVISYHFREEDAVMAAETYAHRHHRRAIVGLLVWDEMWF